jgi:mRNA-degrading endonuclease YafQ of YafQ-DinJ toxin-antitoxin module
MTVGDLKKIIKSLPDRTPVVTTSRDHQYRERIAVYSTSALKSDDGLIYEDHGDDHKLSDEDKRVGVLVVE